MEKYHRFFLKWSCKVDDDYIEQSYFILIFFNAHMLFLNNKHTDPTTKFCKVEYVFAEWCPERTGFERNTRREEEREITDTVNVSHHSLCIYPFSFDFPHSM